MDEGAADVLESEGETERGVEAAAEAVGEGGD